MMRFRRSAAVLMGFTLMATAFTACGDDDDNGDDATTTPVATATDPAPEPTTPASQATPTPTEDASGATPDPTSPQSGATSTPTAPPPGDDLCIVDDLSLETVASGGAAGTQFQDLVVTNGSSEPCAIEGFPGVSLLDANGQQIGEPAERNTAVPAERIELAPGEQAHAVLGIPNHQNFDEGVCDGPSTSLRLIPPGEFDDIVVPFEDYVCPGFAIRAFEPGGSSR